MLDNILNSYLLGRVDVTLLSCMKLNGAHPIEIQLILDIFNGLTENNGFIHEMYKKYYGIRILQRKENDWVIKGGLFYGLL